MSKAVALLLAWRYLKGTVDDSRLGIISKVCFFSIFVGTLSLALEVFIMEGFEKALEQKMQSIYPELVMESTADESFNYLETKNKLQKDFSGKILYSAPAHTKRVVLRCKASGTTSAVTLKAVDPIAESTVSSLETKLLNGVPLESALEKKGIVIGKKLAEYHELSEGDTCTLLFSSSDDLDIETTTFESTQVRIGGIMDTGIMQYDKYMIVSSLATMKELLQDEDITMVGLKMVPGTDENQVMEELKETLNVTTHSWKTLYPSLVAVAKLEKYVMFFLLALITLIASTNIISLLFMQILRKKTDIALLKIMGLSDKYIVMIFLTMGVIISSIAAAAGLFGAFIVGLLLQTYPFITLPDSYLITHLPVHMEPKTFLLVFVIVVALSLIASWFSARSARHINVTTTLRFEG